MKISEFERKTGEKVRQVQICRTDTKGKVISLEDMIEMGVDKEGNDVVRDKVQLSLNEYDPTNKGGKSVRVKHYLDMDDALVLAHDLLNNTTDFVFAPDYKGSPSKDYSTGYEARTLNVAVVDSSRGGGKVVQVSVSNGPGVAGDKGQVSPAKDSKDPVKSVSLYIAPKVARSIGAQIINYVQAKTTWLLLRNEQKFGFKPS